jgi:hypothetical protein
LMALGILSMASACFILLVRPYDLIFKLVSANPMMRKFGVAAPDAGCCQRIMSLYPTIYYRKQETPRSQTPSGVIRGWNKITYRQGREAVIWMTLFSATLKQLR